MRKCSAFVIFAVFFNGSVHTEVDIRTLIMLSYKIICIDKNPQDDGESTWSWRAIASLSSFSIHPRSSKWKAQEYSETLFIYVMFVRSRVDDISLFKHFQINSCWCIHSSDMAKNTNIDTWHIWNERYCKFGYRACVVGNWTKIQCIQIKRIPRRIYCYKTETIVRPISHTLVDFLVTLK